MARPTKSGLDYFPLDVSLNDDIELIEAEFGLAGFAIVIKIWQKIYANQGYFTEWSHDHALLFARKLNTDAHLLSAVINACLKRGLFNNAIFKKYNVLTSEGIQKRYLTAIHQSKRKMIPFIKEYLLVGAEYASLIQSYASENISSEETRVSSEETPGFSGANPEETPGSCSILQEETTQSKVKENKRKKTKINSSEKIQKTHDSDADFLDAIIGVFTDAYFETRNQEYTIISRGKEKAAAGKILQAYKSKYPSAASSEILEGLKTYFVAACNIKDDWLWRHMSLSIIISKFNEINQTLKNNGRKTNTSQKLTNVNVLVDSMFASKKSS